MKSTLLLIAISWAFFAGCKPDRMEVKMLDLKPYGLDIRIMAPDSAEVVRKDYSIMRDITIRKGEHYFIQIFEFDAVKLDAAGEKLRQLASVREDPFFKEIISEDDQGFIYSKQLDSLTLDYDFRFVRIMDSTELIFQTGLIGTFSLEDVKWMYKSIQ